MSHLKIKDRIFPGPYPHHRKHCQWLQDFLHVTKTKIELSSLFNIPFCKLCERQMENKSVTRNKLLLTDIPSPSSFSILPFILQSLLTRCSLAAPWIFTMNNITHCPSPNNACHIPWDIYCIFYNKEKYSSLFFETFFSWKEFIEKTFLL